MDWKFLVNIVAGLFIFAPLSFSLANVTDASKSYQVSNEDKPIEISTPLPLKETSDPITTTNAATQASVGLTEGSKLNKTRLLQERNRRQGYVYVSHPAKYGITNLFDMCPPLATTCPICTDDGVQVPPGFCDFVVLKVLTLSPPQIDGNGRVCGKFGMLKLYGNFDEKQFRRLLRFSVSETCGCTLRASSLYFLISPLSTFVKDGVLFNQIVFTEQTVLISADRYIENEILEVLNRCPVVGYNTLPPPPPHVPYVPPPTPHVPYVPPPTPYVPPHVPYVPPPTPYVPPPTPYVPPPTPYVPPPTPYVPPPIPHVHPPIEPSAVYPLPPAPPPVLPTYNPPPQVKPEPVSVPLTQFQPSPYRNPIPFLYPSMTKCLIPDSCPTCARLDYVGDITGQYCVAGFAYLAVIRIPDPASIQGADSTYLGSTCMNLRTNIVYDITRTRDPNIMVSSMTALLPIKCLSCFAGLKGPVIVLIMGQVPPTPPVVQLDAQFQVYILPVPATIVLPSCGAYSMYGSYAVPYSLLPIAPQPYATDDCPAAGNQTCPLCQNYPEASFAHACANGFAIVTELNLAGPYFTSQRLPIISVKTTTTYYSKSIEVIISDPPPRDCIKGFFKIIQNIGLAPLNFPGEIIPFVSLPDCECLSQGFKRLLIFSSGPLTISEEGVLHLSKDINIAFLQPEAALPNCGIQLPPPLAYVPKRPLYTPPHPVPLYPRPARVPLTYIPPPPPPPVYVPPSSPPPVYIIPPDYIPPPIIKPPASPYVPPQFTTSSPALPPKSQPSPYSTELPFEETPPPIIGCIEFGNGSCVISDVNQVNEPQFSLNVDEDIPFRPQFEPLNSIIYEDSSVWSPSFQECLPSIEPSCPHNLEESPEKFEDFFCKAKTALLVAVGIDYSNLGNEAAVKKKLTFIQPEVPYIGIDFEIPNNPVSLKIKVTRNKTMERKIQLQNNADYCYKEKVLVLSDHSNVLKPRGVVGTLDILIPGFCNSDMFDKIPFYGILLSTLQPSDVTNPLQLTEEFSFIPLPEGKLDLPDCGKHEKSPSAFQAQATKFWVPTSPKESVICELSGKDHCGAWTTVEDDLFSLPCDAKYAALVLIKNTSAGNSVGPNLEISEILYESGKKVITLNVESNIDDNANSTLHTQYAGDYRCKYAVVQILKDISRIPSIKEDEVLTIIANANCDSPIFKQTNQVLLLLSNEHFYPNKVIPLDGDRGNIIGISPGTTMISLCNANPADDAANEKPLFNKSSIGQAAFPDKSVAGTSIAHEKTPDKHEVSSKVASYDTLELSCKDHIDDTCPVCGDVSSIPSEVYCDSELSLFAEVTEQAVGDGGCTNGVIVSFYDVTVRNPAPKSKGLKLSYTIPSHCTCPVLKEGGHLVLLLDKSTPVTDELSISLSEGKYLYSTPVRTSFPSCYFKDSVQARSKNVDNVFVLDPPYKDLLKIVPELSRSVCPTIDHTCPVCKSMDDKELEDLYCSSEEVLLVSRSKNHKQNTRKFSRMGKATFTQHKVASNYTLEMSIDNYNNPCGLPLAVGNCSESLERFYYDSEDELCSSFTYTGCGGNANNFVSESLCENDCFAENFCEEGILEIKKVVKSSDNDNYLDQKFHYTLAEHCNCSEMLMLKGDQKGYLFSIKVGDFRSDSYQLSRNNYFVPLSKSQRKKQFSCTDDNTTSGPEKEKKKSGFGFFG